MTAAGQMRALADGALDTECSVRVRAALRAAAEQLEAVEAQRDAAVDQAVETALLLGKEGARIAAVQKWLNNADTLTQGDSPYLPDLQDIIDGDHGRDCASGTMMNVEEFYPCSCWKADL